MSISIKLDRKFGKLNPEFLKKAKADFYKGAASLLPIVIEDTILKGISPVQGVNRFQSYSKSYIDQIEGRVTFRMLGGRAVPFRSYETSTFNIRAGKTTKSETRKGSNTKIKIDKFTSIHNRFASDFEKFNGKLKSPVNMTVTGEMMNSLKVSYSSTETVVYFSSPIAKYHNDLGVGKSKVIRPLLPTKNGQRFTALISQKLVNLLTTILTADES